MAQGVEPPASDVGSGLFACSEETVRECYTQACETARAYMDLRFKHFGTFVVVVGLLAAALQVDSLSTMRASVAGVAVVLTVLFWLLDFRTAQYLGDELQRIRVFQERLSVLLPAIQKRRVLLRASNATSLIFLTILILWVIMFVHFSPF